MWRQLDLVFFSIAYTCVTDALGIHTPPPKDSVVRSSMDQEESNLLTDTFVEKPTKTSLIAMRDVRKPVMWVHIHKMAGTFMCASAGRAGEKVVYPNDGTCNSLSLHDSFFPDGLFTTPQHTTCENRTTYFRQNDFTWGQIEREISTSDFCRGDFVYGIVLRSTISRLASYVNWNTKMINGDHYKEWMTCIEHQNGTMCPKIPAQHDEVERRNFGYQEYDNFVVRILGGYEAMLLPPGGLNSTHLEAAMNLLEQFDIVIPLEHMHTELFQSRMDTVIGWHIKRKNEVAREKTQSIYFSDDDIARFKAINKYDIELYAKYAKHLQG